MSFKKYIKLYLRKKISKIFNIGQNDRKYNFWKKYSNNIGMYYIYTEKNERKKKKKISFKKSYVCFGVFNLRFCSESLLSYMRGMLHLRSRNHDNDLWKITLYYILLKAALNWLDTTVNTMHERLKRSVYKALHLHKPA